jgi:hypothetical protein
MKEMNLVLCELYNPKLHHYSDLEEDWKDVATHWLNIYTIPINYNKSKINKYIKQLKNNLKLYSHPYIRNYENIIIQDLSKILSVDTYQKASGAIISLADIKKMISKNQSSVHAVYPSFIDSVIHTFNSVAFDCQDNESLGIALAVNLKFVEVINIL